MKKFLLVAVNAKYIHSNPGIYSLKMYAEKRREETSAFGRVADRMEIEIGEYTINHQMEQILWDIYRKKPDVVGFSCYIWNYREIRELVADLPKILPGTDVWLGGPEVSFDAGQVLCGLTSVKGIMRGEGEETFFRLISAYESLAMAEGHKQQEFLDEKLGRIPGLTFRSGAEQKILETGIQPLLCLDEIPFYYENMDGFENRIVYYESSRGCPFSCSYCLSSIDKTVRFRSIGKVKRELEFFMEKKVPQVKFVDRTFNCKKEHAMEIWQYLLEHDNGITNFHFEVAADLMDDEELELIRRMRPGLIQLEIGVQSANPLTIREIRRVMDLEKVRRITAEINSFHNVHQHLDLIAGLPYEDYESFHRSFNEVYRMCPEQLQLGFLKVLKGSHMAEMTKEYGLRYRSHPPYEVLSTRWLSYGDVLRLKGVEDMVETYYNSRQFTRTLPLLEQDFVDAFTMFETMSEYYDDNGLRGRNHSRIARYEILYHMIEGLVEQPRHMEFADTLIEDLYLRENAKSRPCFAQEQAVFKDEVRALCPELRALGTQVHAEVLYSGRILLFDYRKRDPLTNNAQVTVLREADKRGAECS